ncbi:DUF4145 domain-containing protein [Ralstonia solanacearum]|uniref:DUF4145 domain-containing protein n=1 Tax=Ralstonia solanacearum TaxID=305 RepID=UPI0018D0C989|nr:DUF4145 domain-containing protein [Ralstonia solanacearum]
MRESSNFSFLSEHSPLLADLGATAERLFPFDPPSCVVKLRLLGEALAQEIASRVGVPAAQSQADLLRAIDNRFNLDAQVRQLFHLLRRTGNVAAHQVEQRIGYREGIEALKVAREIAVWFHRTFGKQPEFKPGPFILPDDPSRKLLDLQQQIAALSSQLDEAKNAHARQAELGRLLSAQAEQERQMAARAQEENAIYQQLAEEAGQRYADLKVQFDQQLATTGRQASPDELKLLTQRASDAAKKVLIDEAATRQIIDQQLIEAGWQANSVEMTYSKGARPERAQSKAIAFHFIFQMKIG